MPSALALAFLTSTASEAIFFAFVAGQAMRGRIPLERQVQCHGQVVGAAHYDYGIDEAAANSATITGVLIAHSQASLGLGGLDQMMEAALRSELNLTPVG